MGLSSIIGWISSGPISAIAGLLALMGVYSYIRKVQKVINDQENQKNLTQASREAAIESQKMAVGLRDNKKYLADQKKIDEDLLLKDENK